MGLRPLLFHVDAGWNTDAAVSNIKNLMDVLDVDLITDVIDYSLVQKAQVAFLRSGIPDQDLVQDALFFSGLYKFAKKHSVTDILQALTIQQNAVVSLRNGEILRHR